jgi:hypothetical protein
MTSFAAIEKWLTIATRDLSDDAVERIGAENTEHYRSILDSGRTPEAALASLGDPKMANRQYRRVYLTRKEADVAGALANPKESLKQAISHDLRYLVLLVLLLGLVAQKGVSLWGLLSVLFWLRTPLDVFYPPTTKERCRNHLWIFIGRILLSVSFFAYIKPAAGLVWLVIWAPLVMSSYQYRRWKVVRKLASTPEGIPVVPAAPALTYLESRMLQSLRRRRARDYAWIALVFLVAALLVPLVGGPLLLALSFEYLVPRFVSIRTPERGRLFRRIKWYLLALTALAPACYVIFGNPDPDLDGLKILAGASIEAYLILLAYAVREPVLIQLRNKLPFDQWPERLHQ